MSRVQDWELRTQLPMIGLGAIFFALFAVRVLDTSAGRQTHLILTYVWVALWLVIVAEFLYRLHLSENARKYAVSHPLDVVLVVIPMLQPLRMLRLGKAMKLLRARGGGRAYTALVYVGVYSLIMVVFLALVELDLERNAPGATILNFGDALWWGFTTVTTVGYGDTYPVTALGRVVAVVLMISGVGLVGSVTGAGAAILAQQARRSDGDQQ
jgi:voltage-gated potassium channel